APARQDAGQPKGGNVASIFLNNVRLAEVDAEAGTISATVGDAKDPTQLVKLPVGKDAEIIVNNKPVKLVVLKPGVQVSLQLVVDGDRLVVAALLVGGRRASAAFFQYQRAKLWAAVVQEKFRLAKARVAQAAKAVADAQGQEAIAAAQSSHNEAKALLAGAETEVRAAEDLVAAAKSAYEAIRTKEEEE